MSDDVLAGDLSNVGNAREDQKWRVVMRRVLTPGGVTVAQPVTLAASTVTVTFKRQEPDTKYAAVVTPNWSTTSAVTTKSVGSCVVTFGTAAPSSATVDVVLFRSE